MMSFFLNNIQHSAFHKITCQQQPFFAFLLRTWIVWKPTLEIPSLDGNLSISNLVRVMWAMKKTLRFRVYRGLYYPAIILPSYIGINS